MIPELCSLGCLGLTVLTLVRAGHAIRRADRALKVWEGCRTRLSELEAAGLARLGPPDPAAIRDLELVLKRHLAQAQGQQNHKLSEQARALGLLADRVDGLANQEGQTRHRVDRLAGEVQDLGQGWFRYTAPHVN